MPASPESFAANLQKLIGKFDADKAHYFSKGYPEAQARIDFVTRLAPHDRAAALVDRMLGVW